MKLVDLTSPAGRKALCAYALAWAACTGYLAFKGADWSFPIASLTIFGIGLSALAWLLTRRIEPFEAPVADAPREAKWMLAYLLLYAFVFVGFGLGAIKTLASPGGGQELLVLAYKLVIHLALPIAVIMLLGGWVRPMLTGLGKGWRWWTAATLLSAILFGLLAVVSPSLKQIDAAGLGGPMAVFWVIGAWIWVSIVAGLCEEFLFRAVLQTRITAWLRSPAAGIVIASILFALAHWPGLYLRGGPETDGWSTDPLQVAAFTIATLSPISILFGILWERTRSLLLIVVLHGAVDALPYTAEFFRIWG